MLPVLICLDIINFVSFTIWTFDGLFAHPKLAPTLLDAFLPVCRGVINELCKLKCALGCLWTRECVFSNFTTWKTCGMCGGSQDFLQRGLAGCGLAPTCRLAPFSSLVFEQQSHKQETCIKSLSSLTQCSALSVDQRSSRGSLMTKSSVGVS